MSIHSRGALLVLLSGVFFSTSGLGIRCMESATGWQIVFYRSISMTILFAGVTLWRHGRGTLSALRSLGRLAWVGSFCLAGSFIGMILALTMTTVANVLFIYAFAPLLAALLARKILNEPVLPLTWIALCLSLVGVGVMMVDGFRTDDYMGNLVALVMSVCVAGYTITVRCAAGRDMLPTVGLGALISIIIAAFLAPNLTVTELDLSICLALGVFQVGLGYLAFTLGTRHVRAAEANVLALGETVCGPLWVF